MINKKGNEPFSWFAGLIAILAIIIFAIVFVYVGHFGEKPVTVSSSGSIYSLELQRVGAYIISSDFNSSMKGKILKDIYSNVNFAFGEAREFPKLPFSEDYYFKSYPSIYDLAIIDDFYLKCSKCENKYLSFGLKRISDGK